MCTFRVMFRIERCIVIRGTSGSAVETPSQKRTSPRSIHRHLGIVVETPFIYT